MRGEIDDRIVDEIIDYAGEERLALKYLLERLDHIESQFGSAVKTLNRQQQALDELRSFFDNQPVQPVLDWLMIRRARRKKE